MDSPGVKILDARGNPMARPKALAGGNDHIPYDAASQGDQRLGLWNPQINSPDNEINFYRDKIVSRSRDVVRNDGWASGGIDKVQDAVVGAVFRPISKPDYRALALYSGNTAFDENWATEFGNAIEAYYRTWALDPNRYCDSSRRLLLPQMLRLGFRHKIIDGDALALMQWRPERLGKGKARYATCVQLIDPDRLSNPQLSFDNNTNRGGVVVDYDGVAKGYYIRRAHQGDWFTAGESLMWDLIPRETEWGRPCVVHDFDPNRAGQHRGGAGILSPILQRLKMLIQYDGTELDAAIINAIFSAFVTSPFDHELVKDALGDGTDIGKYQEQRADFHKERSLKLGGARIPTLFPGEKIETVAANRPNTAFPDFEKAMLRSVASALGISSQQLTQDWSDTNYSSARAAIIEAWRTLVRRRQEFGQNFATPIYSCFVEECMEYNDLPMPKNSPAFEELRAAYSMCRWLGPGRGWIDPVKEREGAMLGMEAGLSTLETEVAESGGEDWQEVLAQKKRELEYSDKLGLPRPAWGAEEPQVVVAQKVG